MESFVQKSGGSGVVAGLGLIIVAVGLAGTLGLIVPTLVALAGIAGIAALVFRPHLAVAVVAFLVFTNAPMVIAGSQGFNNLTELILVFVFVLAVLDFRERRRIPRMLPYTVVGGVIYVASLAMTAFVAHDPGLVLSGTTDALKHVIIVVLLSAVIIDETRFRWAFYGLIAGVAFLAVLTVVQSVFGLQSQDFFGFARVAHAEIAEQIDSWRYVGSVDDPNYYAQLLLLGLPLAASGVVTAKGMPLRSAFLLATAVILVAMLLTMSRGAVAALAVVVVVALRRRKKWLAVTALAVVAVLAISVNFIPPVVAQRFVGVYHDVWSATTGNGFIADKAIAGRLSEMGAAARLFFEHPVLGVGYDNFDGMYQDVARLSGLMSRGEPRHAHNLYLEILAERGATGFFFFAALIASAMWSASVGAKRIQARGYLHEAGFARAINLSLVAYLATSVFLHEAFTSSFWMLIALAMAAPQVAPLTAVERFSRGDGPIRIRKYRWAQGASRQTEKIKATNVTQRTTKTVQKRTPPFDVVAAFRRYFVWIIVATVFAGQFGALGALTREPVFSAHGALLFRFEREYFPSNVARTGYRGEPIHTSIDGAIQTEIEILGSRDVMKEAIQRSGYMPNGDLASERLPAFQAALSLRRVEGTQVVRAFFEDPDPKVAENAISAVFATYLERRDALFDTQSVTVLSKAAAQARKKLYGLRTDLSVVERELAAKSDDIAAAKGGANAQIELRLLNAKCDDLTTQIQVTQTEYQNVMAMLSQEELAQSVRQAQGPAIKVLEVPEADPKPIGLSVIASAVIAALLGLVAAWMFVSWLDWRRAIRGNRQSNRAARGGA